MELRRVAEGAYACLQENSGLGFRNSGLIAAGGGLVIDAFWDPPPTRELKRLYSTVCPEVPDRLVNTHHNSDHCWGNPLLSIAEITGHPAGASPMLRERPAASRLPAR